MFNLRRERLVERALLEEQKHNTMIESEVKCICVFVSLDGSNYSMTPFP